ncbi:low molecular weight phosphotyrosine protein phosphatase-like [Physella acuta]|uniref:low molecular weight phosphotyrosine protein phosphatase-like n=1 Tax=Physella acuta TaxID=109671 RepID=UPI0027DD1489|nr:low molecular weight phosphotyrosine protein phosphatase-like [Physella acuta]XP_059170863.1 low molecular weight phosphotyrosine protein phosphatase-like [Physella acuta]XP_059170864.1 low molecular weight phosphotyrosine protein phosphatase-like [Physella acuta]
MSSTANHSHSVLFVCLGNICRSTMAEGIFQHLVQQRGLKDKWLIDSAGTGDWHIGKSPDDRTMQVLKKNGIKGYKHSGRLITEDDFTTFEYIFGMDHANITDINDIAPANSTAKISLLGSYDPQKELIIEDPYFAYNHNKNAFNEVYEQCMRCCTAFLDSVSKD